MESESIEKLVEMAMGLVVSAIRTEGLRLTNRKEVERMADEACDLVWRAYVRIRDAEEGNRVG